MARTPHLDRRSTRTRALGASPANALSVSLSVALSFVLSAAVVSEARAGDILRGGAAGRTSSASRPTSETQVDKTATQLSTNARDALARTTQAVDSVRSMQEAARQIAITRGNVGLTYQGGPLPAVPNGLKPGGLEVDPDVLAGNLSLWKGAKLPVQSNIGGSTRVVVPQTEKTAVLNWKTFNIGKDTTLEFNQRAGGDRKSEWIAFNKIDDPSGKPSQILGSLKADGQVYVINRNGIIFGGSSQISLHTLVASTLPINDNLINQGLLNNRDAQFLFSALTVPGGSDGTPAFNPTISDPQFSLEGGVGTYTLREALALANSAPVADPKFTFKNANGPRTTLVSGTDYNLAVDPSSGIATANFTPDGLAKINDASVRVTYTPKVVKSGDVVIAPGATLTSPPSADGNGGRLMFVGSNVINGGTLSSPGGQTILAAGLQVGVAAHSSSDPSLRGLDVWVGAVNPNAGAATNRGLITAMEGSVGMFGKTVNQFGAIESSTSVNLNGRIDLVASYGAVSNPNFDSSNSVGLGTGLPIFVSQFTGDVNLGESSVTRILPDYTSIDTAPGFVLPARSQINLTGQSIYFGRDAMMLAPNADVTLRAGQWNYLDANGDRTVLSGALGDPGLELIRLSPGQRFFFTGGQIYLDSTSLINVAGTPDVFVPLSQSILDVEFRSAEFADSPLQRAGLLRGVPLTVDIRKTGSYGGRYWMGTPLGDVTGLAGLIQRNAAQLTTVGGNVTLQAGNSIVIQKGATIDVSGGYFRHEAGMVETTRLLKNGQLVDIANALPDQVYDGIYNGQFTQTSPRWGVTETFTAPWAQGSHFEESYVEGANGGTLKVTAPSMAIDGELLGLTVPGPRQRSVGPELSSLSLAFNAERFEAKTSSYLTVSPTPPTVTFQANTALPAANPFSLDDAGAPLPLQAARLEKVYLSPDLLGANGFGNLTIENTDGEFEVPLGTQVTTPARGSLTLRGTNIRILGDVSAPAGNLTFSALNLSPEAVAIFNAKAQLTDPPQAPNAGRGNFILGSGASLSAAGLIANDLPGSPAPFSQPLALDGGKITIEAYSAKLTAGSSIDVSGGASASSKGSIKYGAGGKITINTGRDLTSPNVIGGTLVFDSTLSGYSGGTGGTLAVQANAVQVGGKTEEPNTLVLTPDFFRQGGFTSYSLTGIGPVGIDPNLSITPVAENWRAGLVPDLVLTPVLNSLGYRSPVSLSFTSLGFDGTAQNERVDVLGQLTVAEGVTITTDPGASVSFTGQTVTLLGSVSAPGGRISITGAGKYPLDLPGNEVAPFAQATVYIGPKAVLSAVGTSVVVPDKFGHRLGTLYSGGTITVSGNIVAESGAIMDVSGSSEIFDLPPTALGGVATPVIPGTSGLTAPLANMASVPTRIDSAGGLIDLTGSEMLFTDATLLGRTGGPTAAGGTLSIASNRFVSGASTSRDINLVVTAGGKTIAATNGDLGVGSGVVDDSGTHLGRGYFAADRFTAGGFDSLDLGFKSVSLLAGNVQFEGPVTITARGTLRVAAGGIIQANSTVKLTADYVKVGQGFLPPVNPEDSEAFPFSNGSSALAVPPTFGPGNLTIRAGTIDVGTVSLQGIGSASLIADGGDIRGNGTINIAGDLTLRAAQIYPTTLGTFNIFAYDHGDKPGSVTIVGSGTAAAPLSAGGSLNIFASKIVQGGVLRAPMGTITLGWDGTDIDLSDADIDKPFDPVARGSVPVPVASQITLKAGSLTSTSADGMLIPFGVSPEGANWIDPRGVNTTVSGLAQKSVAVAGQEVTQERGSTIDLRGGGDLYAFRWIPGAGGSIDILGTATTLWNSATNYQAGALVRTSDGRTWSARTSNSGQTPSISVYWSQVAETYAILPGYTAPVAPYAPFNSAAGDPGYISNTLRVGDQVYLDSVPGLAAGSYTLLPARYALLPGAFLVTPTGADPLGTVTLPGGSTYTAGIVFNQFSRGVELSARKKQFEVAPYEVVHNRVEFANYTGNEFLTAAAAALNIDQPQRLPRDAGRLAIQGNTALNLNGIVLTDHPTEGRGASIDVSSFADIRLVGSVGAAAGGSTIVLKTDVLESWGATSLLIGGLRHEGSTGTTIEVRTPNLTLDNAGSTFAGPEITLVAKNTLLFTEGSSLTAKGNLGEPAQTFLISGDGTLVRVSSDLSASINRTGTTGASTPLLKLEAGAAITGKSVTLDSSFGTDFASTVNLQASALALGAGQINVLLGGAGASLVPSDVSQPLNLSGQLLADVGQVGSLTLRSYRTIDFYGTGTFGSETLGSLNLQAAGIRGFEQSAGTVLVQAGAVSFGNASNANQLAAPADSPTGTFQVDTGRITFGVNAFSLSGYADVVLNATGGVNGSGTGSFTTPGNLTITTPVITGSQRAVQTITAVGDLVLNGNGASGPTGGGGLGASLIFNGASIVANTSILAHSGKITLNATGTAADDNLTVGGVLDVSGTSREFFDLVRYTDAGSVALSSKAGSVQLLGGSVVSVAADAGGGNAGTVTVSTGNGAFVNSSDATFLGNAAAGQTTGSFVLDAGTLASFNDLNAVLNKGGFFQQRNFRVRTGDITIENVGGQALVARDFRVSVDHGNITVLGEINVSGETGGKISLIAGGNLTLEAGSLLDASAVNFSSAGKGGDIHLEAGAAVDGVANTAALLDLKTGSKIDLGVDAYADYVAGNYATPGSAEFYGKFQGTLHLRAPRTADNSGIQINSSGAEIKGASSILVEGFQVLDLTGTDGVIAGFRGDALSLPSDGTVQKTVYDSAADFMSHHDTILANLGPLGALPNLVLAPGVEIINLSGDLTIGEAGSSSLAGDWNLSDFRFGPRNAPGVLTLRASGDIVFNNALSDGFAPVTDLNPTSGNSMLWLSQLSTFNPDLPLNTQSWSYHLTAGSDLGAADSRAVLAAAQLQPGKGSLLVGEFYLPIPNRNSDEGTGTAAIGPDGTTANSIAIDFDGTRYEVIRTGTGNIDIAAGADVQLRNQFATIYTAGVRLPDPNTIFTPGDFVTPVIPQSSDPFSNPPQSEVLGAYQQVHLPQWSMAGGDVTLSAQSDIRRVTLLNGVLTTDSSRQLPNNWLYRRGYVDPATGLTGSTIAYTPIDALVDPAASTAWWTDFTNFFEGVGTLGGGNVTLLAGRDVINVDALAPTNARMPGQVQNADLTFSNIAPDASKLVELGGGDVVIRTGNNIDGGVYYAERGHGVLFAGGEIKTNESRSPSAGILVDADRSTPGIQPRLANSLTWLPTTLFVGKSFFDVSARGDILLGPISNPFLLPQASNNKFWYKTHFTTFSEDAGASVVSFGGGITHRLQTAAGTSESILQTWLRTQDVLVLGGGASALNVASNYQPWLRLSETSVTPFSTLLTVNGPNLSSTAFAGDIKIQGSASLFPSRTGGLELAASGSIIGLNPAGSTQSDRGNIVTAWISSTINVSDSDPALFPGIASPLAIQQLFPSPAEPPTVTNEELLRKISVSFQETGSYIGNAATSQVQQALHAASLLHAEDHTPIRIYATGGDITGLTLFAPKATEVVASQDINDASFYIQHVAATDISVVSAGRDIIPNNENAPLRSLAKDVDAGNLTIGFQPRGLAGDIQINGPGVLEVLAGHSIDLGKSASNSDGTGTGITSVGNVRNPYLPLEGADLVVLAGVAAPGGTTPALGLSGSALDFKGFIDQYLGSPTDLTSSYLTKLGTDSEFENLTAEQQDLVALEAFYKILRDAGRSVNDPAGTSTGYAAGFAAIDTLFGATKPDGEILTQSRDIRTRTGGAISVAAPGGDVTMATNITGNPKTPPGVVTEFGGSVSMFVDGSVKIGRARIFTLRGGDITIWASNGDIAAGNAPKTVISAPPTRVVIDVNSANVQTDLGGLATGGGIGVLAAVKDVPPGNVDLIAPNGAVDAGDAGIRVTGNLNIAATVVLNASNITAAGTSSGVPVVAPSVAPVSAPPPPPAQSTAPTAQDQLAKENREQQQQEQPSIIVVEVVSFEGGEG